MTKIFYSAQDVADLIGVSVSKAYQIIAQMNSELKEKGYLVQRGRVPIAYFNDRFYGGVSLGEYKDV